MIILAVFLLKRSVLIQILFSNSEYSMGDVKKVVVLGGAHHNIEDNIKLPLFVGGLFFLRRIP